MTIHTRITTLAACVALATLSIAQSVAAQRAENEEKTLTVTGNGEGRVSSGYVAKQSSTGSRTNASVLATPQSLSIIGRDEMSDRSVQTTTEALGYTPGVYASTAAASSRFDYFSIRGFDATRMGALLDGLRSTTQQSYVAYQPYGLESIDVLRGPAGFLYGSGSPGGVVNAVSKRPTATPIHEVGVQTGSHGRYQGQFDLAGPVSDDKSVLYRVVGVARDSNTQFDNVPDDTLYLAPSLTWQPDAATRLTLLSSLTRSEFGPPRTFLPLKGSLLANPNGKVPHNQYLDGGNLDNHMTQTSIGYELEHQFDNVWSLHSAARFSHTELMTQTYSGLALNALQDSVTRMAYEFGINGNILATDNNLKAEWDAGAVRGTSVFGVSYRHTTEDYYLNLGPVSVVSLYDPAYRYGRFSATTPSASTYQTADETGLYLGNTFYLLDSLALDLSGREDWARVKTANRLQPAAGSEQNDNRFTWRAGLSWLTESGITPYVSYTTSFAPVLGTDGHGGVLKPTTGKQLETGIKYQPERFDGLFTLAWFDLKQDNVSVTDPSDSTHTLQIGQVTSKGIEASASAQVTPAFKLLASYTWNDLENTKTAGNSAAFPQGKTPTGLPEQQASLWGDYTVQSGPLTSLGLGVGVRYTGKTWADAGNSVRVPDTTLVDAAARYDLGQLDTSLQGASLALNVNNLFNKDYYSACSATVRSGVTSGTCTQGFDRTVRATLSYRW